MTAAEVSVGIIAVKVLVSMIVVKVLQMNDTTVTLLIADLMNVVSIQM